MRTITINPKQYDPIDITLGRAGENLVTEVTVDCSSYAEEFGAGTGVILVRPEGQHAYVASTTQEGAELRWLVAAADIAIPGAYALEVQWYVDELLKKSAVLRAQVEHAIGEVGKHPPEREKTWVKTVLAAADAAQSAESTASEHARSAAQSAQSADGSEHAAAQALADLLRMLGTDVATLVGGKIPVSQIPAIATTEIYHAASQAEMDALEVQRGDICIRTDETKSYVYDGGWVYLSSPTDYASRAGYAETAGTTENASAINGHRLVQMERSAFETAVKDADTYYLVWGD